MKKEQMKSEITRLIEKYNREKGKKYNEEATKNDFILPLFKVLGWNVEDSNEVSKEENISGKRVDYGFRIDGIPKFFLEAKGLDEDLEDSRMVKGRQVTYAEQAINYAYYKGCNWAILTNFKGIVVYDAWAKSSQSSFRFAIWADSLLSDFDNNLYLLSREAFEQGLLDKKYSTKSRKRPITEQLLLDFTNFRAILSKDVYNLNKSKNLNEEELDEAIQRLFDRLIFIRNCEDRELEPYDLLSALRQWKENRKGTLVSRLRELFTHFDDTYNSKIFSKHLCDQVDISDNVLSRILDGLYTTEDGSIQYDFSLIDADVLGNIYEQYLGHILKKTKLTESKAKRKEEGIYYTPSYIVDYIVRNTVGELIKNKKVDVSKIKILDPACGSGSFLIKAFDVLNGYYSKKEGYNQTRIVDGDTYKTKTRILRDNIFGVDLDKQAVDIAQLNLLLKVAEKKKRLPLLQQNIKNGNSLVEDPHVAGDKAFEWKSQFSDINDGFELIIGNPPYVRNDTLPKTEKEFFMRTYTSAKGKFDLYLVFVEKAIRLLKDGGLLGFIIPSKFMATDYGLELRKFILQNCKIIKIVDVSQLPVFSGVATYPCILILQKDTSSDKKEHKIQILNGITTIDDIQNKKYELIEQNKYDKTVNNVFTISSDKKSQNIISKINNNTSRLEEICEIKAGIHNGNIRDKLIKTTKENDFCKPLLIGSDIGRYSKTWNGLYINYNPNIADKKRGEYCSLRDERIFIAKEKLLVRDIGKRLPATYDDNQYYCMDTIYIILLREKYERILDLYYILGILNSNVAEYYFRKMFGTVHVGSNYQRYKRQFLVNIPIKIGSKSEQKLLSELVENLVLLNKQKEKIKDKMTDKIRELEENIRKVDLQIDELVYKIYGITVEEKKVIEESLKVR
jgi:hypothetical protein